jgi:uncharacterized protein
MMIPGLELRFISPAIGYGVCTPRPIPRGTIVWVLDPLDQPVPEVEYLALPALLQAEVDRYAYVDDAGDRILCWDLGRYMNHSCAPTGRTVDGLFELVTRDIPAGGELTTDYAALNIALPSECACGSESCRGTVVQPDSSFAAYQRARDREVAAALRFASSVEQPLADLLALHPSLHDLLVSIRRGQGG